MGGGGEVEDFPHPGLLGRLLGTCDEPPHDAIEVDVVFNGDTFDLLKIPLNERYPRHITAEAALEKLAAIAAAHRPFFESLGEFLSSRGATRRVHFIVGNHDAELLFPQVQAEIRRLCGSSDGVSFPGFSLDIGQVHIEHGSQADRMFQMDADKPFLDSDDGPILNLSWGSLALLEVAVPLYPLLHHLDRVKPRARLFEVMPEVKELLLGRYWRYWTRDYVKGLLARDEPLRHLTWNMVKEIVYRFASVDTEVSSNGQFRRHLMSDREHRLYVVGHRHEAAWWSYGDRKLLQTGCMRDEYMLSKDGAVERMIPKTYAEAYLRGDQLVRSQLVELPPPPRTPRIPKSVLELLPVVRRLLGTPKERQASTAAREAHEAEQADSSVESP
jgi:hypothetical protein